MTATSAAVTTDRDLDEFEAEVRSFFDGRAPRRDHDAVRGVAQMFEELPHSEHVEQLAAAKRWRADRFDSGYGWISGPPEFGGLGLPRRFEWVWNAIEAEYDIPDQSYFGISLGMVAPTIHACGTDELRDRYLRSLHRGDIIGCQMFSEPEAGSDLANVQTRAVRDGDGWVLTGQKVWTSGAQYSQIGEVLVRTNPDVPKHHGLTVFLVDLGAAGVDIRPLRQITGGAHFNEVFLDEVRVPDHHRLGDVDGGWRVALTTLMNERASIGAGGIVDVKDIQIARLIEMTRRAGCATDPVVRQRLARVIELERVLDLINRRVLAAVRAGEEPGPELSITKQALGRVMREVSDFVGGVLGPRLFADTGEPDTYAWSTFVTGMTCMGIAGGTDEVMKNIVGERVLGLPKEPAVASPPRATDNHPNTEQRTQR